MATNATERELIAQRIMQLGTGVLAIANPCGAAVDAILIKEPDYHVPANATEVVVRKEYTGDAANSAYLP
jgi:hypothetical protein